eukprot:779470-Pelagomonas_calceolata.AAC.1
MTSRSCEVIHVLMRYNNTEQVAGRSNIAACILCSATRKVCWVHAMLQTSSFEGEYCAALQKNGSSVYDTAIVCLSASAQIYSYTRRLRLDFKV